MVDEEKEAWISRKVNSDYPSHNYPILKKEATDIGLNVKRINKELNDLLIELNNLYSNMAKQVLTDHDENNYHDNEIKNIIEAEGIQIYYQEDKDWFYRNEEKRYSPMNDNSSWYKIKGNPARYETNIFEIN